MLALNEFSVGKLIDIKELSLVLPRDQYEHIFLVIPSQEKPMAIILSNRHKFEAFNVDETQRWSGVVIHGVRIEVDKTDILNPERETPPPGTVIRKGSQAFILANIDQRWRQYERIAFIGDLPVTSENVSAGFRKWSIALGEGPQKRELFKVDVTTPQPE